MKATIVRKKHKCFKANFYWLYSVKTHLSAYLQAILEPAQRSSRETHIHPQMRRIPGTYLQSSPLLPVHHPPPSTDLSLLPPTPHTPTPPTSQTDPRPPSPQP
jgi:hypothetical protein